MNRSSASSLKKQIRRALVSWLFPTGQPGATRRRIVRKRPAKTAEEFKQHKYHALKLALDRIAHFNTTYQAEYKLVSIRNQKTRWGSCSKAGNLSFHYKIALLPPRLADYVIVHEICHLIEFNHSPKFWQHVARTIADHRSIRRELRAIVP